MYWRNKPDQATMRPDCVSACNKFCAKHVCYIGRLMDKQTDFWKLLSNKPLITQYDIAAVETRW